MLRYLRRKSGRLITPHRLGKLAYGLMRTLFSTLSIQWVAHQDYADDIPYLFAFWHGKQWLPVFKLAEHKTTRAVLVSSSRDGDILSSWLTSMNYTVLRGSSRNNNIRALLAMKKTLQQGASIGFGVDGPTGPIYQVKPGMTYLAERCQVAIVPVGSAFSSKWILHKAWDKYQIPRPFAKAVCYVGEPIFVMPGACLTESNQLLTASLNYAEQQAAQILTAT